jgi:ABC-2 type transport system ATP-binding protein
MRESDMSHTSGRRAKKKKKGSKDIVIQTKDLVKTFGDLRAVDGLDLKVRRGQLYGLLGPNGSGKTTTIRMLLGLLVINEGWAEVFGTRIPNKGLMDRIGYMPQENAIYREITAHDNVSLYADIYNVPLSEKDEREKEVLDLVDLWDWRNELADNLSGGMMHRLSLACALIHDPELFFLDEPTVGVDPELRDNLWGHFKDLCNRGKTIVLTTHYIEEARHCDLVGLMRQGRIIAEDTPKRLMEKAGIDTLEGAFLHFTRRSGRREAFKKGRKKVLVDRGEEE